MPELFHRNGVLEVSPFGFSNFGNTNVQWMGDRLFLGYDAGRPLEVDPYDFFPSVYDTWSLHFEYNQHLVTYVSDETSAMETVSEIEAAGRRAAA